LETPTQFEEVFNDIFSYQDVGTYGALLALVEFDREELKNKCLDNSTFRNFLESVPKIKDLVNYFYDSKYEKMLETLESVKGDLKYDYLLEQHLPYILREIRNKALVQYVLPYTHIDLNQMAQIFDTSLEKIESEVVSLIQSKKIKARIDSHNKILSTTIRDQKNITLKLMFDMGEKFEVDVEKYFKNEYVKK